jgi:pimeloyl-ACP methyl ester carboxylesterase
MSLAHANFSMVRRSIFCTLPRMHPTLFTENYWTSPDSLRLYARVYESEAAGAATVLCLHGLTRNSRDFDDLAPHLRQRYRVIVPDLRGRGLSARDTNPQNYQPAIYVQDILALMDSIGAPQVTVIGTSLGGLLAMMLGVGYRTRIAGIVLNDIGPEADPVGIAQGLERRDHANPHHVWRCVAQLERAALVDDRAPRLSRGRIGSHSRRCRSDDRRDAARGTRRHGKSMAFLERAARHTHACDSRRALRHLERRNLRANESRESPPYSARGRTAWSCAVAGRAGMPRGHRCIPGRNSRTLTLMHAYNWQKMLTMAESFFL